MIELDKITLVLGVVLEVISITSMIMSILCDKISSLNKHSRIFEMIGIIVGFICLVMFFTSLALGG